MKVLSVLASAAVASALTFADLQTEISGLQTSATAGTLKRCAADSDCLGTEGCQVRTYSAFVGTPVFDATKAAALVAKYSAGLTNVQGPATGTGYCVLKANCDETAKVYVDSANTETTTGDQEGFTSTKGCTTAAANNAAPAAGAQTDNEAARAQALKGKKWEVKGPAGYEAGSFKGYSEPERVASKVVHEKLEGSTLIGLFGGFGVFFIGYILTVIYIFIDINRRGQMYQTLIDEDLAKMNAMGLSNRMAEFHAELQVLLKGKVEEGGVDDMLVTNALELQSSEFQKYM